MRRLHDIPVTGRAATERRRTAVSSAATTHAYRLYVDDVAALRREFLVAGVADVGEILDQTWGNLEFGLADPDGNQLGFAQDKAG
jgi:hypothetical protein